jgi:DNA repair protein RecO (recombination protein O)
MTDSAIPHRHRSFRVEAVVLRHTDWGEADRLLTLFTLEMGKVRAIAKGVRKLRSRKAGHLEPFTHASLLLARGRDILIITQADTLDPYTPLRDDLLLSTYAYYVVELLDRFTYEEGENRSLYRLLVNTLAHLSGDPNSELVIRYYEMRLLDLVGFRPQLFHCAIGGEEIKPQDQYFSAEAGGAVCPTCAPKAGGARPVSMSALKYMRHFQRSSYAEAAQASPNPIVNREIELLMQHYLTYLLERGLNTPAFIRRLRSEQTGEA